MGCSASRSQNLVSADHQPPCSSNSNPSSSSPSSSRAWSDSISNSYAPASRTLSLSTSLVHHPPLRKGDTNHLVSLTSTTYGSLVLVDSRPSDAARTLTLADQKEPSSPSPDSVINTWELMEGLDDFDFDFCLVQKPAIESPRKGCDSIDPLNAFEMVEHLDSKPLWKHLSEESLLSKMDPNVVSSYRRALTKPKTARPPLSGTKNLDLPGTEDRIVLYYTSLRGIRRTYEDCCAVRMIFRGFRVNVDERDISMDAAYREQLQSALGGKAMALPRVFIRGRYIGGADEIKQLHECGELAKLLEDFPVRDVGSTCGSCGDIRFLPCPNCNGSRKVYDEDEGRLRRCPDCNENGLIRCPSCCA